MKLGLLKRAVLQLQMLQVGERESENAETWRKEGPLSPALIILLHSCVFTGRAAVRTALLRGLQNAKLGEQPQ